MTTGSTPRTASIDALTADRFVDQLYTALAWDAAVRLGDLLLASRLVERALQRAWHERDRFATADALVQHARDAVRDAVQDEVERRGDFLRVDGVEDGVTPGDVHFISTEAVRHRLERTPAPSVIADRPAPRQEPIVADLSPVAPPPPPPQVVERATEAPDLATAASAFTMVVPTPFPTPAPSPAASAPSTPTPPPAPAPAAPVMQAAAAVAPTFPVPAAPKPSAPPRPAATAPAKAVPSPAPTGRVNRWRAVNQQREGNAPRARPHLKSADVIAEAEGTRLSPRALAAIGGGVALAVLAWVISGSGPADEAPLAALSAPLSGVASTTTHGQSTQVSLADGSTAQLAADASVQPSSTFADGVRALTIRGPMSLSLVVDEDRPVAIGVGTQRWVTEGGSMSFVQELGRTLVAVDSGSIELVSDTARARAEAGSAVAVDATGALTPLDEASRDAAFAWRRGRLQLRDTPPLLLRERALQWFDVDLAFRGSLSPASVMSLNVPLGAPDSLVAAIAAAGWGTVERRGREVTITARTREAPPARRAARPRLPTNINLPTPKSVVIPPG